MAIQTDGNMRHMQEEAMRRAREMHARASPPPQAAPAAPVPTPEPPPPAGPAAPVAAGPVGGIEALVRDKDRTIILALLLLLGSEPGKNTTDLLLALLFLLM